jgi:hypothetical protein
MLGGYQLLNIPAGAGIGFFKKNHSSLVQVLGSRADFWLVCGWYMPGIEIDIAFILN